MPRSVLPYHKFQHFGILKAFEKSGMQKRLFVISYVHKKWADLMYITAIYEKCGDWRLLETIWLLLLSIGINLIIFLFV